MRLRSLLILLSVTPACFDPAPPRETTDGSTGSTPGSSDGSDTVPQTDGNTTALDTSGDSGGCADDCDDGIACTADACVDGACVNTPMDTLCDDGLDCTVDSCDAAMGCVATPDDTLCDDGVDCTVDGCDPLVGCGNAPDDTRCDDGIDCTNDACDELKGCGVQPDDALCDDGIDCTTDVCDPVAGCEYGPDHASCNNGCGTGTCDLASGCIPTGGSVLVLNGSGGGSTASEDAVASLGYTPIVVTDFTAFDAGFDAGGFGAIVWDVPSISGSIPASTQMRLNNWVLGGGRLIFGFWSLNTNPATAATLGVTVVASFDTPMPIHPDAASPVNLFDSLEMITPPLSYPDIWGDNGDTLSLAGPGYIAARFNDPVAGPGAIAVTHGDRVIANGFVINEIGQSMVDSDGDGVNDGIELLRNELDLVCNAP